MPRYEFSEGSSNKFWEITLEGSSFTTTYGKIGSDGQATTKSFKSDAEAKKAYDKLIAEKVKKGYELAGGDDDGEDGDDDEDDFPSVDSKSNPDLEKAILANPADVEARLVYADWLQGQGDPRGELIAVQHALLKNPASSELKAKEAEILEKSAPSLLGPLKKWETTADGNDQPGFTWSLGFIQSARFAWDYYADESREAHVAKGLAALLAHPSGRFVEDLVFGLNRADPDCEYQEIIDALAYARRPTLRSLHLADFEYPDQIEMSWTALGNLSTLWATVPNLEKLIVQGGSFTLGKIDLPRLKHAEFRTGGLALESVKAIASARWPKIEHLEVWFGNDGYGAEGGIDDIQPILEGEGLPSVRYLGLKNATFVDAICQALPNSKILARIERLDLSMGSMTDAGAMALVEMKGKLAHLKSINVSRNYISDEGLAALARIGVEIVADDQGEPDVDGDEEYRYVSVGE